MGLGEFMVIHPAATEARITSPGWPRSHVTCTCNSLATIGLTTPRTTVSRLLEPMRVKSRHQLSQPHQAHVCVQCVASGPLAILQAWCRAGLASPWQCLDVAGIQTCPSTSHGRLICGDVGYEPLTCGASVQEEWSRSLTFTKPVLANSA